MPFPIQRTQTDRGREFFAVRVQLKMVKFGKKLRPNKPGSPHLNGKVERSQKTNKTEFYATIDINTPDLDNQLSECQHYYCWVRPYLALKGKTTMERFLELSHETPLSNEVCNEYDPAMKRIRDANYKRDLALARLKLSP